MKKILASIAARASAEQITIGIALFLAVTSLAAYYASVSGKYRETIDTLPTMAATPLPEARDLPINIAGDVELNAPTGAVVTQTAAEEFLAPITEGETSSHGSNADESARTAFRLKASAAAGQMATQASDASGYGGAGASQVRSNSVGATGAFGGGGGASSGGGVGLANNSLAKSGTVADRNAAVAPNRADSGSALSDARDTHVASGADDNPGSVPTLQDPVIGPSARDGSGGSGMASINGDSPTDAFGLPAGSANDGAAMNLAGPAFADHALSLLTDQTQDGNKLTQVATLPDAGSTLLLLGYGIVALLACSRRNSFRFSGPSAQV